MAEAGLPPDVQELVDRHLASMEHVEVLLLLRREAERAWTPHEVAREIRGEPASAAHRLQDLAAAGLASRVDDAPSYRYGPASPALRAATDSLAVMYNERPVTLVRALYSRPNEAVRSFSDAFRIRRTDT